MKQIPLYEQIYEEIREKIEERGYRVGDRLPSEKELSEQYHVSRITSKKAVELLAEEGLVTRIPGKGTFVIEHQEMPKALEIPADSMTEKKPLPDVLQYNGCSPCHSLGRCQSLRTGCSFHT